MNPMIHSADLDLILDFAERGAEDLAEYIGWCETHEEELDDVPEMKERLERYNQAVDSLRAVN